MVEIKEKSLEEMRLQAVENLSKEILDQTELYLNQEKQVMMALLNGQEDVWITKQSGAKVCFKIDSAIQGLATMRSSLQIKKLLLLRFESKHRNLFFEDTTGDTKFYPSDSIEQSSLTNK